MSVASTAARSPRERAGATPWRARLPWIGLGIVLVLAAVVLQHAGRATTFYFDDWNFVLERRGWGPYDLLRPHNEHLSVVPVLAYKLLFETVGLAHYWVYRAVLTVSVLGLGTLVFLYGRRRVGDWPSLAIAASLMLMGPAYIDLIWAFQIGFVVSLVCGVGALLAVDRGDRTGDVLASVLLAVALGSSSLGVPLLAAAIVEVALRPDRRRRWWVPGVPLVLYVAWRIRYGSGDTTLSNISEVPRWIADAADDAAGAAVGLGATYGAVLALVLLVLAARAFARPAWPSPRLVALAAAPVALWSATALARADMPEVSPAEPRYLLPGGVLLVLLAMELGREWRPAGRLAVVVALLLGAGALANANALSDGAPVLRGQAEKAFGGLAAMELAGPERAPDIRPVDTQPQIIGRHYWPAIREYGSSPAWPLAELEGAPSGVRAAFDRTLWSIYGPSVGPGEDARTTGCVRAPGAADEELPAEGVVVRAGDAPVQVRLKRYADGYPDDTVGAVAPGATAVVRLPGDAAPRPWRAQLESAAPFRTCHGV